MVPKATKYLSQLNALNVNGSLRPEMKALQSRIQEVIDRVRELEQCVRSVLVRGSYAPRKALATKEALLVGRLMGRAAFHLVDAGWVGSKGR